MLKRLILENFKAFSKYNATFENFNLLIGENNNGKSTLIDALRLVSNILSIKIYKNPTRVMYNRNYFEGFILAEDRVPFSLHNLRYEYDENKETVIKAHFEDQVILTILFPPEDNHAYFYYEIGGINIGNSGTLRRYLVDKLGVIPYLGVFDENEDILDEKYVKRTYGSRLTPNHFRNFWFYNSEGFDKFSELLSNSWDGVAVNRPEMNEGQIKMFYLENRITREISWAGTGLMIWMQLLTHITKLGEFSTIILDEPDIYLHSDLQRKLIYMLEQMKIQVILTSHSVELINEVDPDEIIFIDKTLGKSKKLKDIAEVQQHVNQLGSAQNVQLSKLIKSRKCLIVEGKDFKILRKVASKLGHINFQDGKSFSVVKLEGFSNSDRLKDSKWYFENVVGQVIKIFIILDRDYYPESQIENLEESFNKNSLYYHIWARKEIENYFLDPQILFKVFIAEVKKRNGNLIGFDEFLNIIRTTTDQFCNEVYSKRLFFDGILIKPNAEKIKEFKEKFDLSWKHLEFRLATISGKEFLTKLNFVLSSIYKVSITIPNVLRVMSSEDIPDEMKEVIEKIVKNLEL